MNIILLSISYVLELIYKLDKSWWYDASVQLVASFVGAAAAFVGSFSIFRKTINNDRKKEEDKKREIRKQKLQYLQVLLKATLKSLKTQADWYKDFADALRANPIDQSNIKNGTEGTYNDISRIVFKLNLEKYLQAYIEHFKNAPQVIDEFKNIISECDFIEESMKRNHEQREKAVNFDYERRKKLNEIIELFTNEMASNMPFQEEDNIVKENINLLAKKIWELSALLQQNKIDVQFNKQVIAETATMYSITDCKFAFHLKALANKVRQCSAIYDDIIFQNTNLANSFQQHYEKMLESWQLLDSYTANLRNALNKY